MKHLRAKNWCGSFQWLDEINERCTLGIETKAYSRIGHHAFFKVVDAKGCRAARQNRQLVGFDKD